MPVLNHTLQTQVTGYYCGPAAVQVALACRQILVSQGQLAAELGTTTAGTDSSEDVARVLNTRLAGRYRTRYIGGQSATGEQAAQLWADVITTIDGGYGLVANVAGRIRTQDGTSYSYPGGHYVTITGYDLNDRAVFVSDVAVREYWADINAVADWIATRGYAYAPTIIIPGKDTDMQRYMIARGDVQLYLCNGMESREITEADIPHIRELARVGLFELVNDGEIRESWYPGAFGPVASVGGTGFTRAELVQISREGANLAEDT